MPNSLEGIDPEYFNKINQFASKPTTVIASMECLLTAAGVPESAIPAVEDLIQKFINGERQRCAGIAKEVGQNTSGHAAFTIQRMIEDPDLKYEDLF